MVVNHRQRSKEEWYQSRQWLGRAAFLLIGAFVLLVASYAFRPLLIGAIGLFLIDLYAIGRYGWHVQRSALEKRHLSEHAKRNPILRMLESYPVPFSVALAVLWIVIGLVVVELMRHPR